MDIFLLLVLNLFFLWLNLVFLNILKNINLKRCKYCNQVLEIQDKVFCSYDCYKDYNRCII